MGQETILTLQEYREIIKRSLQPSNDFEVIGYEEKSVSSNRPDYLSIKIKISLEGNTEKEVTFAAKLNDRLFPQIFSYKNLEDSYPDYVYDFMPRLYLQNKKLIVFEDFLEQGFSPQRGSNKLNLDHIKLVLFTLAKYHARSMVYEETKSQKFKHRYQLTDEYPNLQKSWNIFETTWFKARLADLLTLINFIPQNGMSYEEFKDGIHNIIQNLQNVMNTKGRFRRVLCNGHMWGNTFLFKQGNAISSSVCKFINFEMQHYNFPALDVLQFIYSVTNREMRKHNLKMLMEFYYGCVRRELQEEGFNIDKVFSLKKDFEISVRYLLPAVKLQIACLRQIDYLDAKYEKQVRTDSASFSITEIYKNDTSFNETMTEAIVELKDILTHPRLILEDCFEIIQNKIGTTNYELLDYKIIPLGKVSGFLGDHNKLQIDLKVNNQRETLNMFAKCMPTNNSSIKITADSEMFYKEMFIYQRFVQMLEDLDVKIIHDCVVPCYFTRYNVVMVFDDFEKYNFKTLDPRKPLSYDTAKMIIKNIAKFHASSIILEEKLSEKLKTKYSLIDHFEEELQEVFFSKTKDHNGIKTQNTAKNCVEHEIDLFPDPESRFSDEEVKIKARKALDMMDELVKPSTKFRNVVCHGDLWVSNIMVQLVNEVPTDCRFIDYQICRYCPPTHDILAFIYLTTNRNTRKQHMKCMIDFYYSEFSKNLRNFGFDIEKIYPYDTFMESIEYMMPEIVCQTVLYFQMTLTNSEIAKEYLTNEESELNLYLGDRRGFVSDMANRDPLFKERASESIQDLREMCMKYF